MSRILFSAKQRFYNTKRAVSPALFVIFLLLVNNNHAVRSEVKISCIYLI